MLTAYSDGYRLRNINYIKTDGNKSLNLDLLLNCTYTDLFGFDKVLDLYLFILNISF